MERLNTLARFDTRVSIVKLTSSAVALAAAFAAASLFSISLRKRVFASSPRTRRVSAVTSPVFVTKAEPPSRDPTADSRNAFNFLDSSSSQAGGFLSVDDRSVSPRFGAVLFENPEPLVLPDSGIFRTTGVPSRARDALEDPATLQASVLATETFSVVASAVSMDSFDAKERVPTARAGARGASEKASFSGAPAFQAFRFCVPTPTEVLWLAASRSAASSAAAFSRANPRSRFRISKRRVSRSLAAVFSCASFTRHRALLS
jgi:hypothetical protein|mmetsp:Transcript_11326/g.37442  ORF Transcript_11326/g.37442 Transcript_11326/m.37442 type:complete len:261 (-) Transcript_11326:720-1502(-)